MGETFVVTNGARFCMHMYLTQWPCAPSYVEVASGTQAMRVCTQAFQHHARRLTTDPIPEGVPQPAVDPLPAMITQPPAVSLPAVSQRRPHFLPQPRRQPKTKDEVGQKPGCPVLVCKIISSDLLHALHLTSHTFAFRTQMGTALH